MNDEMDLSYENIDAKLTAIKTAIILPADYDINILLWEAKQFIRELDYQIDIYRYRNKNNQTPIAQFIEIITDIFRQRDKQVAGTAIDYDRIPLHKAHQLVMKLATWLQEITGVCRFNYLIPSLAHLNNDRDKSNLIDKKIKLHQFVLNDKRDAPIFIYDCLKRYAKSGVFRYTHRNKNGRFARLNANEIHRVVHYSFDTAKLACLGDALFMANRHNKINFVLALRIFMYLQISALSHQEKDKNRQEWEKLMNIWFKKELSLINADDLDIHAQEYEIGHLEKKFMLQDREVREYQLNVQEKEVWLQWIYPFYQVAEKQLFDALNAESYSRTITAIERTTIDKAIIKTLTPRQVISFSHMLTDRQFEFYLPDLALQVIDKIDQAFPFYGYYLYDSKDDKKLATLILHIKKINNNLKGFIANYYLSPQSNSPEQLLNYCRSKKEAEFVFDCPILNQKNDDYARLIDVLRPLILQYHLRFSNWFDFIERRKKTYPYFLYPSWIWQSLVDSAQHRITALAQMMRFINEQNILFKRSDERCRESRVSFISSICLEKLKTKNVNEEALFYLFQNMDSSQQLAWLRHYKKPLREIMEKPNQLYWLSQFLHHDNKPYFLRTFRAQIQSFYFLVDKFFLDHIPDANWRARAFQCSKENVNSAYRLKRFLKTFPDEADGFFQEEQQGKIIKCIESFQELLDLVEKIPYPTNKKIVLILKSKLSIFIKEKSQWELISKKTFLDEQEKNELNPFRHINTSPTQGQGLFDKKNNLRSVGGVELQKPSKCEL